MAVNGALLSSANCCCRLAQSRRWGSNPQSPHYGCGALPLELHRPSNHHSPFTKIIPVRNRTPSSTFEASRASVTLQGQVSVGSWQRQSAVNAVSVHCRVPTDAVPGAGVEPAPAGSEPAVLPLDDPGIQESGVRHQGSGNVWLRTTDSWSLTPDS